MEAAKHDVERKTVEQRHQMSDLERLRHSCAHVLATAVLRLWPKAKLDIGPPTADGFYYDFEVSRPFTPEDLQEIEKLMKETIESGFPFKKEDLSRADAEAMFSDQPYKIELIKGLPEDAVISIYRHDNFVDLCQGPHVHGTSDIPAMKLLSGGLRLFCVMDVCLSARSKCLLASTSISLPTNMFRLASISPFNLVSSISPPSTLKVTTSSNSSNEDTCFSHCCLADICDYVFIWEPANLHTHTHFTCVRHRYVHTHCPGEARMCALTLHMCVHRCVHTHCQFVGSTTV